MDSFPSNDDRISHRCQISTFSTGLPGVRGLLDGGSGGCALVRQLVQDWPEKEKTRIAMRVERHRYRDSNPGFRTENPAS